MKKLFIMMGVPGSGKSTWLRNNIKDDNSIIVSRDEIRFSLLQDGDDYFEHEGEVYSRFIDQINAGLSNLKDVWVDQTTLNRKARTKLLNAIQIEPKEINIVYMERPLEQALEWNARRSGRRLVPEETIKNMYNSIQLPTEKENINNFYKIIDDQLVLIENFKKKTNKNIWFTSDWHFGHEKDFLFVPRGFDSTYDMAEKIVANHNAVVEEDDDVYVLGDLMLGNNDYGLNQIKRLKGKLHIIRGNHDTDTRMDLYKNLPNVIEICEAKTIKIGKQYYFLCHYPTMTSNYDDKPYHSHLINLYGHTHQKTNFYTLGNPLWTDNNPFMYHVGVDSHNCCPVSIGQINKDIHDKVQELYQKKIQLEKEQEEYYRNGLGYFDTHPACGTEILD